MRVLRTILAATAASLLLANAVPAAELQPHRAVYDLSLADRLETSGITAISGRMVHQFTGSACEGWTVSFRYVAEFQSDDGSRVIDERSSTFEEGDGSSFTFSTHSYLDRNLDREVDGAAVRSEDGLDVTLDSPEPKEVSLPAALFPTQHLLDLIARARSGETFYEERIFDGSDGGEKVMTTTAVIGRPAPVATDDAERAVVEAAGLEAFWPVDMAYFPFADDETGEVMPTYHISFRLHESGLTRDLVMDYGDFAINGRLVELEFLEAEAADCPD